VPQDYAEAARLFRESAKQGNIEAQFRLGTMYALGEGVSKDLVKAYVLLAWVRALGHKEAIGILKILERIMSPEQIAEAQKLAGDEWGKNTSVL